MYILEIHRERASAPVQWREVEYMHIYIYIHRLIDR